MTVIDFDRIEHDAPSPAYVVDLGQLRHNLSILEQVQQRSGAKILLALKAFALPETFALMRQTLKGVCASSPWEARLGREEFGREVHTFAAAYRNESFDTVLSNSDHLVFNSFDQLERFRPCWQPRTQATERTPLSIGLRVNPEHSEGGTPLYDPCAPQSRLGIVRSQFEGRSLEGVEGLHFHTLCEQGFAPLERTAKVFEQKFGQYLPAMKWVNFGGGHHLTRSDYDLDGLIGLIEHFHNTYDVTVYLEPGEAVVLDAGVLVAEVLDVVQNQMPIALLDVSATCHMPDVLEMPYRPEIVGGDTAGSQAYTYRLAGPSCLAGDVIGDWSFARPLVVGDRLVFKDMAHYTMVKSTLFNGLEHPHLCTYEPRSEQLKVVRRFDYDDFRRRFC